MNQDQLKNQEMIKNTYIIHLIGPKELYNKYILKCLLWNPKQRKKQSYASKTLEDALSQAAHDAAKNITNSLNKMGYEKVGLATHFIEQKVTPTQIVKFILIEVNYRFLYGSSNRGLIHRSSGAVLVFDITDPDAWEGIKKFHKYIFDWKKALHKLPYPFILIGVVPTDNISIDSTIFKEFASQYGGIFSTLTQQDLDNETFYTLKDQLIQLITNPKNLG